MRDQAIEKLMLDHNLPYQIAEKIVGDDGTVDEGKLQVAHAAAAWGRTPAASGDPRLVQALSNSYWAAAERRDAVSMMSLKDAISKIGGTVLPRKEEE